MHGLRAQNHSGLSPAVETYYRFDGNGNLRELSLGGRPCILLIFFGSF